MSDRAHYLDVTGTRLLRAPVLTQRGRAVVLVVVAVVVLLGLLSTF